MHNNPKQQQINSLPNIQLLLDNIPYEVRIGAELEFYIKGREEDVKELVLSLKEKFPKFEEERGWHQFENVFFHTNKIGDLLDEIDQFKSALKIEARKFGCLAIFSAKPFSEDYGSALHLHLSLHNELGSNIFADFEINNNRHLQRAIAGILEILNESLFLLCGKDDEEYMRFDGKYMAPQNVSWGGNNRSTAIRIPDGPPRSRRIEFRVPSANANPLVAVIILLLGVINGLKKEGNNYSRVYGNAFDSQYELECFHKNYHDAEAEFLNSTILMELLAKYIDIAE